MRPVRNMGKLILETYIEEIKCTYIEQTARIQIVFLEDHPDCTRTICIYERVGVDEANIHAVGFWFSASYCRTNRFHFLILLRQEMIVWSSDCDIVSWTPSIFCMGMCTMLLWMLVLSLSPAEKIHAARRMYNYCMTVTVLTLTINIKMCNKCL